MNSSLVKTIVVCLSLLPLVGCISAKDRVEAPVMDATAMTDAAMAQCDADSDGFLTKTELKAAPGLLAAARDLDENGDDKLSREEVQKRFDLYVQLGVGLKLFNCTVVRPNGNAIADAEIELVPEPFMEKFISAAKGRVIDPTYGTADVNSEAGLPGVHCGMYRVVITSPSVKIPAKYNTNTTLGVEVAPVTQMNAAAGTTFTIR